MEGRFALTVRTPVVVVGTFRSASTLVAELLGSRDEHHYVGFELSEQISDATGVPFAAPGSDDRTCPALGPRDATPAQARSLRELVVQRARCEGAPPGVRPVVKNPHLWHRLGWLRALLPEVRIVATVRDLRPTVASLKVLWQRAVRDHDHLHHLPPQPDRCWDYVPPREAAGYDPRRTFPGGDIGVLAEFWLRANRRLAGSAERGAIAAVVRHERTLEDPDATMEQLQRRLGLDPVHLDPPEPIEPGRQEEWHGRLTPGEHGALDAFVSEHRQELGSIERRVAALAGAPSHA